MNAPVANQTVTATLGIEQIRSIIKGLSLEELFGDIRHPDHPDRLGYYQYAHSGGIFFPLDPRPEQIVPEDLAAAGSRICRFNGQTDAYLSVAEHQWLASHEVPEWCALEALMHDTPEHYIGDQIRPLKALPIFGDIYLKIEDRIARAIADRFKLVYPWPKEVILADEALVKLEIAKNINSKARNIHQGDSIAVKQQLFYWQPPMAAAMWISRFRALAKKRGLEV